MRQARNASNVVTREYYSEGKFVPGAPVQPYYYGVDQIGSVRRVFASTSNAPAFSYDPYGNALQSTPALTDFNYAGMFYNADSGLSLTQYRAYDPVAGRWLSRDPSGEASDRAANLYVYVGLNPVFRTDQLGLQEIDPEEEEENIQEEMYPPIGPNTLPPPGSSSAICTPGNPSGAPPASSFSGSGRSPLQAPEGPPRNSSAIIENVPYSGHALDQMQNRGIPPSVTTQTLMQGQQMPGNQPGTTQYYDQMNNISVITNSQTGVVITVRPGR
ncbi:MAG: RHS repeat-associated core domain-containing protein [Methylovirgula sp.]